MTSELITELTTEGNPDCKLMGEEAFVALVLEFEVGFKFKLEIVTDWDIEFKAVDEVALVS